MKKGDRYAFNLIFDEHAPYLINYGRTFTTNWELVDDCIQELFVRIWLLRETLKETDNIRFYLISAFRRELYRQLKEHSKRSKLFSRCDFEVSEDLLNLTNSGVLKPSNSKIKALNSSYQKLTPRQREIIYLKFYNELSINEIAEVLKMNKKAVYNALSKSMIKFRKVFMN
ncbi:RNA polymerase sigma factor [Aestuariibaculum sediminum]|uniref:Sigma-70 family RNA polymerase sigma factor n=1 Tax=Aestuariibaculum sediminum TaxID=2770637 RepID=A0A8J6UH60_9FLAO|nr:sigma-70 family RNA polymerase sigma factor [Aestuariibaculum sediminum]MBD0832471.1 sigma-70 family RNA polymerase sigma factor [Aestuariibaculum sediminum]